MKVNELAPTYVSHFQQLDHDVIRAQRLQELADIAEWRNRRLEKIKEWSEDPVKRAAIQAEVARESQEQRGEMAGTFIDDYRVRTVRHDAFIVGLSEHIKITPIAKPQPRRSWWQRLLARIMRR